MNGYTSGLTVGVNHDPYPWLHTWRGFPSIRTATPAFEYRTCPYWAPQYEPRAEYDVPTNPLLLYVRKVGRSWESTAELAHSMLVTIRIHDAALKRDRASWLARYGYTPDEIEHARRVLSRLVALS